MENNQNGFSFLTAETMMLRGWGRMVIAVPMLALGVGSLCFTAASDWITRPKQSENSLYVTCKKDAPAGLISRGDFENLTFPPDFNIDNFVEGAAFREWCDVQKIEVTCDRTLKTPRMTIAKTETGYTVTRPSKYCHLTYSTKTSHSGYDFDR